MLYRGFDTDALRGTYSLVRTTAPALATLSLADAKLHLRVDITDDDAMITALILAATQLVEEQLGRSLIKQSWRFSFQNWYRWEIDLPRAAPGVTVDSITYYDVNNALQTVDPSIYQVDTDADLMRIRPVFNMTWPSVFYRMNAISVNYTAGYATGSQNGSTGVPTDVENIPGVIIAAIKLMLGHLYENRQEVIVETGRAAVDQVPLGVSALLAPYRIYGF
jgi:uncharacterized phiE125 gp8 family phage protein